MWYRIGHHKWLLLLFYWKSAHYFFSLVACFWWKSVISSTKNVLTSPIFPALVPNVSHHLQASWYQMVTDFTPLMDWDHLTQTFSTFYLSFSFELHYSISTPKHLSSSTGTAIFHDQLPNYNTFFLPQTLSLLTNYLYWEKSVLTYHCTLPLFTS